VAAVLLGRRVVAIDPYDNKLSRYVAFAFGSSFDEWIRFRSVSWLAEEGLVTRIR
jgi:hypothetical protein